jgi:hypothetical protein
VGYLIDVSKGLTERDEKMAHHIITATLNGESQNTAEVLGAAFQARFESLEVAETLRDELADSLADFGLDPATEYSVELEEDEDDEEEEEAIEHSLELNYDPSSLGPDATADDYERFAENLSEYLEAYFGCSITLLRSSSDRADSSSPEIRDYVRDLFAGPSDGWMSFI